MNIALWQKVDSFIVDGELNAAIDYLEAGLKDCVSPHFKSLIGATFTNKPESVAQEIHKFIQICTGKFSVQAVYLEMNGFDINTDLWYFDFFGYKYYSADRENLDWLARWDSGRWPAMTLTGLEKAQAEFKWYSSHRTEGDEDIDINEAVEYAVLLVMCKFGNLIEKAVQTGIIQENIPILATAHDFDIIPRFAV
jgi:hypothetical protein